jgi:hypothetical protein
MQRQLASGSTASHTPDADDLLTAPAAAVWSATPGGTIGTSEAAGDAEKMTRRRSADCGGPTSYSGSCGADDCRVCRPGCETPDEIEADNEAADAEARAAEDAADERRDEWTD